MNNSKPARRFIAGAVCPACNTADSIKMWIEDEKPHRECVSCGYTDILGEDENPLPEEPPAGAVQLIPVTQLKPGKSG